MRNKWELYVQGALLAVFLLSATAFGFVGGVFNSEPARNLSAPASASGGATGAKPSDCKVEGKEVLEKQCSPKHPGTKRKCKGPLKKDETRDGCPCSAGDSAKGICQAGMCCGQEWGSAADAAKGGDEAGKGEEKGGGEGGGGQMPEFKMPEPKESQPQPERPPTQCPTDPTGKFTFIEKIFGSGTCEPIEQNKSPIVCPIDPSGEKIYEEKPIGSGICVEQVAQEEEPSDAECEEDENGECIEDENAEGQGEAVKAEVDTEVDITSADAGSSKNTVVDVAKDTVSELSPNQENSNSGSFRGIGRGSGSHPVVSGGVADTIRNLLASDFSAGGISSSGFANFVRWLFGF